MLKMRPNNFKNAYGDSTVDVSTVRQWVHHCGKAEVHRTCRPSTALMQHNICRGCHIICGDRQVTMDELCSVLSISKGSDMSIMKDLANSKVCARWGTQNFDRQA
jgi:hypothetical protein